MKLGAAMEWLEDQGFLPGRREIRERERERERERIQERKNLGGFYKFF